MAAAATWAAVAESAGWVALEICAHSRKLSLVRTRVLARCRGSWWSCSCRGTREGSRFRFQAFESWCTPGSAGSCSHTLQW
eukprot:6252860-Prymnesium_polylepis.1